MVERQAFLAKPKHQYRVSQRGEHDWSAKNKENVDYQEYLSLPHFMLNFNYKENGKKKSFSCQTKTLISCI